MLAHQLPTRGFHQLDVPYATDGFSSLAPTISILKDNPQKICTSLKDS